MIRHAEKENDGTKDPNLSEEGKERAKRLTKMLSSSKPSLILSTPYQRTQNTVVGLSKNLGISIEEYHPNDKGLLAKLLEENKGKTIVISGHSNTTPVLVNQLIGANKYQTLGEDEYGKIFIVSCVSVGSGKEIVLTY